MASSENNFAEIILLKELLFDKNLDVLKLSNLSSLSPL